MIRVIILGLAFFAPLIFPAPFAAGLAFIASFATPLAPLIAGMVADAVFYSSSVYPFPLYTLLGLLLSLAAWGVRRFMQTSIMR